MKFCFTIKTILFTLLFITGEMKQNSFRWWSEWNSPSKKVRYRGKHVGGNNAQVFEELLPLTNKATIKRKLKNSKFLDIWKTTCIQRWNWLQMLQVSNYSRGHYKGTQESRLSISYWMIPLLKPKVFFHECHLWVFV